MKPETAVPGLSAAWFKAASPKRVPLGVKATQEGMHSLYERPGSSRPP